MKSFTVTELRRNMDAVLDAAAKKPVVITRRGKPTSVIMSIEEFEAKFSGGPPSTSPDGKTSKQTEGE